MVKNQFWYSFYDDEIEPLLPLEDLDLTVKNTWGIHYKEFMGTYLLGPLLILNQFTIDFANEIGMSNLSLHFTIEA